MTSQEASRQVEACERQITVAYDNLRAAARSMGSSASQAQASNTSSKTMRQLIISLIGLFLFFASHPVWGVLLILAGIFFAWVAHDSAASVQGKVETQVRNLNSALDSNSTI